MRTLRRPVSPRRLPPRSRRRLPLRTTSSPRRNPEHSRLSANRPRQRQPRPRRSTVSPTGSSFIFHSIRPPGSTMPDERPCSSSGRRRSGALSGRPGSSPSQLPRVRLPAAISRRSRPRHSPGSTRHSTRSGWFASRPSRRLRAWFSRARYDTATCRLGPLQEHTAFVLADAPRALLQFALDLFSPTALITGQEGGRALLLVRGGAITPASEMGKVVSKGTVFFPLRLITMKDHSLAIRRIAFTYLQTQETEARRLAARSSVPCAIP